MTKGEWDKPDFSECCPLCGGRDCARYLGIYQRSCVDLDGRFITSDLPILRFICRRKGKGEPIHRTFSLLPYQLIPYRRFTIRLVIFAVLLRLKDKLSMSEVCNKVNRALYVFEEDPIDIGIMMLYSWQWLCQVALDRFRILSVMYQPFQQTLEKSIFPLRDFLQMANCHVSHRYTPPIRGPDALALDFYERGGGCRENAHFLFRNSFAASLPIGRTGIFLSGVA